MIFETRTKNDSKIYILFWGSWYRRVDWRQPKITMDEKYLEKIGCPETNCVFTRKNDYFPSIIDFDALIFNIWHENYSLPKVRSPNQLYIMESKELVFQKGWKPRGETWSLQFRNSQIMQNQLKQIFIATVWMQPKVFFKHRVTRLQLTRNFFCFASRSDFSLVIDFLLIFIFFKLVEPQLDYLTIWTMKRTYSIWQWPLDLIRTFCVPSERFWAERLVMSLRLLSTSSGRSQLRTFMVKI